MKFPAELKAMLSDKYRILTRRLCPDCDEKWFSSCLAWATAGPPCRTRPRNSCGGVVRVQK
jgi:hypothetical protein